VCVTVVQKRSVLSGGEMVWRAHNQFGRVLADDSVEMF